MNRTLRLIRFAMFLLVVLGLASTSVTAQMISQWSPQQRIPNYGNESKPPYLVADENHTVHVFNNQAYDDAGLEEAIYYRRWTVAEGWTSPVDIILSPMVGAPIVQGAFLDLSGMVHLIFFAGNERGGAIFYSRAPAADADRANNWSTPIEIGENAGPFAYATLTGDGKGNLFIVYQGKKDGVGLYEVHSTDGGDTWSSSTTVYVVNGEDLWPVGTRTTLDSQGRLHAVWSVVDRAGIDQAVFYASLDAAHEQWSTAILLASRGPGDYKAAYPSIISYHNELMVIYQDSSPATRWMRRSPDGGRSWTDPVRPFQHDGEYSHAVLLVDGNDVLHIVLGFRRGDCCHGMWHGVWLGDRWGELEPVVMGPKSLAFDPSAPEAVVSQGNVILATWWTDTGGGPRNGAWYSYVTLDGPELPVMPLPVPTAKPTPTEITTSVTPAAAPVSYAADRINPSMPRPLADNPAVPLEMALLPVVVLVVLTMIVQRLRSH